MLADAGDSSRTHGLANVGSETLFQSCIPRNRQESVQVHLKVCRALEISFLEV